MKAKLFLIYLFQLPWNFHFLCTKSISCDSKTQGTAELQLDVPEIEEKNNCMKILFLECF